MYCIYINIIEIKIEKIIIYVYIHLAKTYLKICISLKIILQDSNQNVV